MFFCLTAAVVPRLPSGQHTSDSAEPVIVSLCNCAHLVNPHDPNFSKNQIQLYYICKYIQEIKGDIL